MKRKAERANKEKERRAAEYAAERVRSPPAALAPAAPLAARRRRARQPRALACAEGGQLSAPRATPSTPSDG